MANIFSEIENEIFFDENIIFDKVKIKNYVFNFISERLEKKTEKERPFYFEEIIYDFFDYFNISIIKTKKTRDFGIDGVIKLKLDLLGEIDIGLQIKYKTIGSNDIDVFLSSLRNSELQLGVIVCKESRKLQKYELNTKIKAILLSKGINVKEKILKDIVNINPVFVLKLNEIVELVSSNIRSFVMGVYKK
ncbi:MAG: restriction endonuclease [Nanoarchaeota archaeon]